MKTFVIASLAAVVTLAGLVDDADAFFRRRARRAACCQTSCQQTSACCQPGQGQYGMQGQPYADPNQSFYRGDPSQAPAPPAPEEFRPNSLDEAPSLAPQQGRNAPAPAPRAQGNASGNIDL